MPVKDRNNPQAVGSAITYGCRYSLMAMLGLPPVDDDGNAAAQGGGNRGGGAAQPHYGRAAAAPRALANVPNAVDEQAAGNPFDDEQPPTPEEQKIADEIEEAFDNAGTAEALRLIGEELKPDITKLPASLRSHISEKYKLKRKVLEVFKEAAE
jgi:hypothetical protein